MNNYVLTQEAKEDLWRIYEYGVYKFGELQADKYLFLMHNCFDKIASIPYMFPKVVNYKNVRDIPSVALTPFFMILMIAK